MGVFLYDTFPESGIITRKNVIVSDNLSSTPTTITSKGQQVFKQNCASCHNMNGEIAGPSLRDVAKKGPWGEKENLKKWIKNPAEFMTTSEYAQELKNVWGITMPSQSHLSDADIDEVIQYITSQ